jgi:hypothetical protein
MYLELVKTDFLTLDGTVTSFTLTPLKDTNGTNKIRVDSAVEFRRTREHKDKEIGSHIIYNFNDCNLETTTTPPSNGFTIDSTKNSMSFEYSHMNIPLGPSNRGNAGRWNLLLPEGWRLTELYLSDPYDNKEEDVKKKKQFNYKVFWDTQNLTQLIEMDLRSRRGSFSFIVKGKARNITKITEPTQVDFTRCTESNFGLKTLNEVSIGFSNNINILDKINKFLELKPNIAGLGININEIINHLLPKTKLK